jgi:hypothetical protein
MNVKEVLSLDLAFGGSTATSTYGAGSSANTVSFPGYGESTSTDYGASVSDNFSGSSGGNNAGGVLRGNADVYSRVVNHASAAGKGGSILK